MAVTDIGKNQTIRLDDDESCTDRFEGHCAFARTSRHYMEDETPSTHDVAHDVRVKTMPNQFDRTNQDDVDRVQEDLMIQLAGEVDAYCLAALIRSTHVQVDDVAAEDLDSWITKQGIEVRLESRSDCSVDVVFDNELNPFITETWEDGDAYVDLGWLRAPTYGVSRHQPISDGLYVLVARQHVVPLSTRYALFLTSHQMDKDTEYLSAHAEFAFNPRLTFHPGVVRIARVQFDDEIAWKDAARARRVSATAK